MTQIHVRNGTMCTKETNGYHFCCIVKLSFIYTQIETDTIKQYMYNVCECMRVSIMRFSESVHACFEQIPNGKNFHC